MKPTISKSAVMTRAWNIFRGSSQYSWSFSESLKRAWFVEKETILYDARKEAEKIMVKPTYKNTLPQLNAYDYYNGAGSQNRYFGD